MLRPPWALWEADIEQASSWHPTEVQGHLQELAVVDQAVGVSIVLFDVLVLQGVAPPEC